jgi:hypothetical protein
MGFRFRRSFRLMPGIRLNRSRSGVSTSIGSRGAWFTIGPRGARATVGLPGTGLSYTEQSAWRRPPAVDPAAIPIPSSVSPMDDVADERLAGDEPRPADMDPSTDEPGDRRLTIIMFAIVALTAAVSILWAVLA